MSEKMIFSAEHISAGYGKKTVIHDISCSLQAGTLTALIGANGSGKTTLIRCIANQLSHGGKSILQGECLEEMSVKGLARKVSYIPQKSGIKISLPVLDVVMMGFNPVMKLMQRPSKEQENRAKEALMAVGLGGYEKIDYLTLSEGQKQLVFLARTLIEDTSLLLLDEPDSALDLQNRYLIMKHLKTMVMEREQAGLLCLHDPVLALRFCEQLILLKDGRCVGVLHPGEDSLEKMEAALKEIYGDISLIECTDKNGIRHLTVLWEG
ncbi:ABC transporter ATP-binding protein [Anaerotignum sp.]